MKIFNNFIIYYCQNKYFQLFINWYIYKSSISKKQIYSPLVNLKTCIHVVIFLKILKHFLHWTLPSKYCRSWNTLILCKRILTSSLVYWTQSSEFCWYWNTLIWSFFFLLKTYFHTIYAYFTVFPSLIDSR